MQIGIIGVGVVGGALKKYFETHTTHLVKAYDPAKGFTQSLRGCDATFICVPIPTVGTHQDYSMLEDALPRSKGVTFIRSTALPGTADNYGVFSCPEFLTERSAFEDTCRMDIMTGYHDKKFMEEVFPGKTIHMKKNKECEMAKYAHNAFGALKVNFFNIIYDLCQKKGCDYNTVLDGVLMSGYINEMHTKVPGPDGKFGFGGTCFPKDLTAFNGMFPTLSFQSCLFENQHFRAKQVPILFQGQVEDFHLDRSKTDTEVASLSKSTL